MIKLKLSKFAEIVDGKISGLDIDKSLSVSAVIDSRNAKPNTFFAAFKGEKVDGHDYALAAIALGAEFALTSKPISGPHILVSDVQMALTRLAKYNRDHLSELKLVAITGSQGKTTAKDLTAHLLQVLGKTIAPEASLNNELGVPLLLLQCDESTKYCVVEMGARHKGDIANLTELASPNIGLVLNVGTAHLGEFGSQEAIAETKSELIAGLPENGIAILGTYDQFTPKMSAGMDLKTVYFGERSDCDVRAADIEIREGRANFDLVTSGGRAPVSLQLLGAHQIANALAAASVASTLGMSVESIAAALSTAEQSSKWRMELIDAGDIAIINDSYNANPESMTAALRTLALLAQERGGVTWAILGKMHELGASSAHQHESIGKIASDIGIDHLISVNVPEYVQKGECDVHLVADFDGALAFTEHFTGGDVVLVKASRAENFNLLCDAIAKKISERNTEK